MRKHAALLLTVLALVYFLSPIFAGGFDDDLQAIKKAVKENPNYEAGKEAQWFKVLVTDNKTNKDVVRITVPLCLVEMFLGCTKDTKIKCHEREAELDLRAVFKKLKALGPMALMEVHEEDQTVKVWLE